MGIYIATPFGNPLHAVNVLMNSSVGLVAKKTYGMATYMKGRSIGAEGVGQNLNRRATPRRSGC